METTSQPIDRSGFDEAIANLFSNPKYAPNYLFYGHMVGQCRVVFDTTMQAPAGVNFMHDHFNLYINPNDQWVEIDPAKLTGKHKPKTRTTADGKTEALIPGFNSSIPLEQRLGILKHEMLHILYNHMRRKGDRDHQGFNIASDCAINQMIERQHLPAQCIFPDQFPSESGKVPPNLTAEQYYELLRKDDSDGNGSGSGSGECVDDHSKWGDSQGDGELSEDIAKGMAERATSNTQKARGNVPSELSEWLSLLSRKREITWQQLLRNITGNKRVGIRKTILRPDRRLPNSEWIKGRTKDRKFSVLIISDVSGSVSDQGLLSLWGEVRNICDLTQSSIDLIQVDTQPSKPEKLTRNTKTVQRKACGGTFLSPALKMAKDSKLDYQCIVVTTDGWLDLGDIDAFTKVHCPVIWLIEPDGRIEPSMNTKNMRAFQLKE